MVGSEEAEGKIKTVGNACRGLLSAMHLRSGDTLLKMLEAEYFEYKKRVAPAA
jgi:hypothetical protein